MHPHVMEDRMEPHPELRRGASTDEWAAEVSGTLIGGRRRGRRHARAVLAGGLFGRLLRSRSRGLTGRFLLARDPGLLDQQGLQALLFGLGLGQFGCVGRPLGLHLGGIPALLGDESVQGGIRGLCLIAGCLGRGKAASAWRLRSVTSTWTAVR